MSSSFSSPPGSLQTAASLQPLLHRLFSSFLEEWGKNANRS